MASLMQMLFSKITSTRPESQEIDASKAAAASAESVHVKAFTTEKETLFSSPTKLVDVSFSAAPASNAHYGSDPAHSKNFKLVGVGQAQSTGIEFDADNAVSLKKLRSLVGQDVRLEIETVSSDSRSFQSSSARIEEIEAGKVGLPNAIIFSTKNEAVIEDLATSSMNILLDRPGSRAADLTAAEQVAKPKSSRKR